MRRHPLALCSAVHAVPSSPPLLLFFSSPSRLTDCSALVAKRVKAPWLPPVKDAFDASCFDRYDGPEEIAHYADDGSGWDADF